MNIAKNLSATICKIFTITLVIILFGALLLCENGCSDSGTRVVVDTLMIRDTLVRHDTVIIKKDSVNFKSKYAMIFSGAGAGIIIPNNPIVSGGNSTRMVWVFVSSLPKLQAVIVGQGARENLVIKTNGKVAFTNLFPNGWNGIEDISTLPLDRWVHYAGTVSAGVNETTMNLYRDGVLVNSIKVPEAMKPNSGCNIFLGGVEIGGSGECWFTDSQSFKGIIDEVSFWNITLTQEQIRSRMREHLSNEAGLISYFSFEKVEGTQVLDEINQGNRGRMSNTGVNWIPLSFIPPFEKKKQIIH